jgi:hypothetical protein
MTAEVWIDPSYKVLDTRSTGSALDIRPISATQAAIDFYKEQARAKQIFDVIDKKNQEFREAVRAFRSYSKYTGDLDLPTSIGTDKYKDKALFENDCFHGINCKRINNCSCTPYKKTLENKRILEDRVRKLSADKPKNVKRRERRRLQREGNRERANE